MYIDRNLVLFQSAPACDSMSLNISKWFALPSAPYCVSFGYSHKHSFWVYQDLAVLTGQPFKRGSLNKKN